jgi:hypothetical protein
MTSPGLGITDLEIRIDEVERFDQVSRDRLEAIWGRCSGIEDRI